MDGIVWYNGGNIIGVPVEYALKLTQTGAVLQKIAVVLGIALILFSLILRHGAELREIN